MRLSLCMIVRDEERMLHGALESVRGLVDEMVVVDTGSRDRTVEIAERAGARVFHFPWNDDFAAARNVSLEHATGEWVLVWDADNRLPAGAAEKIRARVERVDPLGVDACAVRLHDAVDDDATADEVVSGVRRQGEPALVVMLMRRAPDIRYVGAVHESVLESVSKRGGKKAVLDVDVAHYGYVTTTRAERQKGERNTRLLRKRLAIDPNDLTAVGYLAFEHLLAGEIEAAEAMVEAAWPRLRDPAFAIYDRVRLSAARAMVQRARCDWHGLLATADAIEALEGPHPDFLFLRGLAHEALGALAEAERAYRAAIAMRSACVGQMHVEGARTWAAAARLGHVLTDLGRHEEAIAAFDDAMSYGLHIDGLEAARATCAAVRALAA